MKRLLMFLTGAAALRWVWATFVSTTDGERSTRAVVAPAATPRPSSLPMATVPAGRSQPGPVCLACGEVMLRAGSMHVCPGCGQTDVPAPEPLETAVDTVDDVLEAVVRKAVGRAIGDRVLADFPTREAIRQAPDDRMLAIKGMGRARLTRLRGHVAADLDTLLDGVRGLGPAKRERLVAAFPTAMVFLLATDEDLAAVDGVGPALAAELAARRDNPQDHLG